MTEQIEGRMSIFDYLNQDSWCGKMFQEPSQVTEEQTSKPSLRIEVDSGAAKDWIKTHKDTKVEDTPLWVLIGLGLMVLEEDKA